MPFCSEDCLVRVGPNWDVSALPLPEKWCVRVKPPPMARVIKGAGQWGDESRGATEATGSAPIRGQDWHHQWPKRGVRKLPELNTFLDQRGDPRGPNSQAQQFWSLLDTRGDSAAGTGAFRSSGCSLGFLG